MQDPPVGVGGVLLPPSRTTGSCLLLVGPTSGRAYFWSGLLLVSLLALEESAHGFTGIGADVRAMSEGSN